MLFIHLSVMHYTSLRCICYASIIHALTSQLVYPCLRHACNNICTCLTLGLCFLLSLPIVVYFAHLRFLRFLAITHMLSCCSLVLHIIAEARARVKTLHERGKTLESANLDKRVRLALACTLLGNLRSKTQTWDATKKAAILVKAAGIKYSLEAECAMCEVFAKTKYAVGDYEAHAECMWFCDPDAGDFDHLAPSFASVWREQASQTDYSRYAVFWSHWYDTLLSAQSITHVQKPKDYLMDLQKAWGFLAEQNLAKPLSCQGLEAADSQMAK